ncbi:cytospin-B isoform X2 [Microcaecilia unicolor]|uniref:Cytospin-B-like isoform X2 n=1 Tax=Microcaecilia unicolor TaxID=1415580 RepID=A0A6P7YJT6_9AMPH|nr:cytospin-B-like isoform X2 [Microcaecilia unicolor]
MGNSGGKSAPGTPTAFPDARKSPLVTGQLLYKPHIRHSESIKSSMPELLDSVNGCSTSWTKVDPSLDSRRESPWNPNSISGSSIPSNPKADPVSSSMSESSKALGSKEDKRATASRASIVSGNKNAANLIQLRKKTSQEEKASQLVEPPSDTWNGKSSGDELADISPNSFPGNAKDCLSGDAECVSEEEETDYLQDNWSSVIANPDFMKLYWPNKVDGEDDVYQIASENLKTTILEVSKLQQELQVLLSIASPGRKVGHGSSHVPSGLRTKWQLDMEDASEAQKELLNVAENWESRLLGIQQRVKLGLNDLDSIKSQNMILLRDSILSKSKSQQEGATEVGTMVSPAGVLRDSRQDDQDKIKELDQEMQRLQQLLNESERQRLEAARLKAELQLRQEKAIKELEDRIRQLEAEKSQKKREKEQEEARCTGLQESVHVLEQEKTDLQKQIKELQEKIQTDTAEWRQFQSDLQIAVTVADNIKQECEEQLEAVQQQLKEAQKENDRLKKQLQEAQSRGTDSKYTSRTLENRKPMRTANMENPAVNGTFPGRGGRTSWAVVSPIKDGVVKSSSQNSVRNLALIETREMTPKEGAPIRHATETMRDKLSEAWAADSGDYIRRYGGSKRGVFLRWCQSRTQGYKNIAITNFSSSWTDGMALCALLHTYLPDRIPYQRLDPMEKRKNLTLAFGVAESIGIRSTLTTEEMLRPGGPDWQQVLGYIESIHQHFEA